MKTTSTAANLLIKHHTLVCLLSGIDRFALRRSSRKDFNPFGRAEPREGEREHYGKERGEADPRVGRLQDVQHEDRQDRKHRRQDSSDHGAGTVNLSLVIGHAPGFGVHHAAGLEVVSDQAVVRAYDYVL